MFIKLAKPLTLLSFLLIIACSKKVEEQKEILVSVGGDKVSVEEFQKSYASASRESARFPVNRDTALKLKAAFLNQLIEEMLILREAEKLGLSVGKEEVDAAISDVKKDYADEKTFKQMLINEYINFDRWREKVKKRLIMEKVISNSVSSQINITDEDILSYYDKNINEFRGDEKVRARQILVKDEVDALKARDKILSGEDFAEVARKISMSPDGRNGGDLGYFSRGVMPPEFDAVVFELEKGLLSDVISSPYGYHLFLVEDHEEARDYSLEEMKDKIEEHLRRDWEEYLYSKWMDGLKKDTKIDVNEEALKRSIAVR